MAKGKLVKNVIDVIYNINTKWTFSLMIVFMPIFFLQNS